MVFTILMWILTLVNLTWARSLRSGCRALHEFSTFFTIFGVLWTIFQLKPSPLTTLRNTLIRKSHKRRTVCFGILCVSRLISEPEKFGVLAKTYVEENSLWSSTDCASRNGFSSPLRSVVSRYLHTWTYIDYSGPKVFPLSPCSVLGWQNDSFISKIRDKIINSSQVCSFLLKIKVLDDCLL